jgi:hypothetical protein
MLRTGFLSTVAFVLWLPWIVCVIGIMGSLQQRPCSMQGTKSSGLNRVVIRTY